MDTITINNFFRGNSLRIPLQFKLTTEEGVPGTPIDITGAKVYFTVKASLDDSYAEAAIAVVQETHTEPLEGKTEIVVLPSETLIPPGEYYWDITVEFDANNVLTITSGRTNVIQGVKDGQ